MSKRTYSYADAALVLGCDHHWVRMKTSRGDFRIVERIEVRPNVLKVFISADDVDSYKEQRRVRKTRRVRLTDDEWRQFATVFGKDKIR